MQIEEILFTCKIIKFATLNVDIWVINNNN